MGCTVDFVRRSDSDSGERNPQRFGGRYADDKLKEVVKMATRSKRRREARAAKFGQTEPCENGVVESLQKETESNARDRSDAETGLGPKGGLIGETKFPRMLARAANWQTVNRFPLDKTEVEIRQDTLDRGATVYESIALNAIELMNSTDPRTKSIGVRAGLGMARLVQADDHKKMSNDDSIAPPVTINQQINVDHRRSYVMQLPANGRDSKNG
jgi:hypothetical protein